MPNPLPTLLALLCAGVASAQDSYGISLADSCCGADSGRASSWTVAVRDDVCFAVEFCRTNVDCTPVLVCSDRCEVMVELEPGRRRSR